MESQTRTECAHPGIKTSPFLRAIDVLGVTASSLCMVHCLAMPFVLGLLPLIGAQYLASPEAHRILASFVVSFCLTAVVPGYVRHGNKLVLSCMLVGLSLVLFATFAAPTTIGDWWELPLISIGNVCVIGAHIVNRRLLGCIDHIH